MLLLGLFGDQAYTQYRRANMFSKPDNAPAYYAGHALRDLVPSTGRYAAFSLGLGFIDGASSDRVGVTIHDEQEQLAVVRNPQGYAAILVSNRLSPSPKVVRELLARYPRQSVAGYSVFDVTSNHAINERTFPPEATPRYPQRVVFGGHIELLGYDMNPIVTHSAQKPDALASFLSRTPELLPAYRTSTQITLYWRKISAQSVPYSLSARLAPHFAQEGSLLAQYPGLTDLLPTTEWPIGQIVRDEFEVIIPADAADRRYDLWVGVNSGLLALEPTASNLPVDSGNHVLVGVTDIQTDQAVPSALATAQPDQVVQMRIGQDLELVGYSTKVGSDGLVVESTWKRQAGTSDYALALVLEQGTHDSPRVALDLPPPRHWKPGILYRTTTMFPAYTSSDSYRLSVEATSEQGTTERIPISSLVWCDPAGLQALLTAQGNSGDEPKGNIQIAPNAPLILDFDLTAAHTVDVIVAWTGRSEYERILFQASAVNELWQVGSTHKHFATIESQHGRSGSIRLTVPKNLTRAGHNTIEISVPTRTLVGWRAAVATLLPQIEPLLADGFESYQGWVELDTVQIVMAVPKADDSNVLKALQYENLLTLYEHTRKLSTCYSADTINTLGQQRNTILEQVNWDAVSTATIADLQAHFGPTLPNSLQASLQRRIAMPEDVVFTASSVPLIRFLGYTTRLVASTETTEEALDIEFYFEPIVPITDDLTIWLHGDPVDHSVLSSERREYGYANFDHQPSSPTSRWQPGQIYVSVYRVQAPATAYELQFGLYEPKLFTVLDSGRELKLVVDDAP